MPDPTITPPETKPEPKTIPCEPMGRGGAVTEVPNPNYAEPKAGATEEAS